MEKRPMNPYFGGILAGALMVLSIVVAGKFFGASTTFARLGALVEGFVVPEHVASLTYFKKDGFKVDWQMFFVIGIGLGSLAASLQSGTFRFRVVPPLWERRFGSSPLNRALAAFFGGALSIVGARMAGGCPSGHGLSGVMQLAPGSLVSLLCFFVGGAIVARLLFGREV